MLFSSITFLIFFLPLTMGLLFCLPEACRAAFLLAASLLFYGWQQPEFLLLILFEIGIGWAAGLLMAKGSDRKRRVVIWSSALIIVGLLFWFKYVDFFLSIFNGLFHARVSLLRIALPLGISFYTFQILSYLFDVYHHQSPVQKSLISFAMYVSMFPQLIAGPIVRYDLIAGQLDSWSLKLSDLQPGAGRFVCGLAKKVLIANQLAAFSEACRQSANLSVAMCWLNALAVMFYIYYDFSGYSDMAIGLGRLMGFSFPENFNYPLTAGTFTEFWRRWHMTLTGWLKDYVYIPLGGNRKGPARQLFNMLVVWLLTGLWHGAAWNFVLWGLLFFVLLSLEKFLIPKKITASRIYRVFVFVMLLISFMLFNDETLGQFGADLSLMFGFSGVPFWNAQTAYYLLSNGVVFILAILGASNGMHRLYERIAATRAGCIAAPFAMTAVLLLCIAWITAGSYSPFLYFRF